MHIEYHAPARFNDRLKVSVEIVDRGRASLTFGQSVTQQDSGGDPLCSARVKVACLAASTFRPRALPEFISREIPDVV